MAGIYFHIPFCKQACIYCDFHFSTSTRDFSPMLHAMHKELMLRSNEINEPVKSIYFGGGTPSLLQTTDIEGLIAACQSLFRVNPDAEITLEANPDDISEEKLKAWIKTGVNRLSIGLQSFDENLLRWMNRAHTPAESLNCLKQIELAGFTNYTVDLMYGIPGQSMEVWARDVKMILDTRVPHFSAYCLTVENKTALHHQVNKGRVMIPDDELIHRQYDFLCSVAKDAGYEHYEISNFARPAFRAMHNSSYWAGLPYLGIGPSAHSFSGSNKRYANIANNAHYVRIIEKGELAGDSEILTKAELFNEKLMTCLRTSEGINLQMLDEAFGAECLETLENDARQWIDKDILQHKNGRIYFKEKDWLLSDRVISDLMQVN